MLTTLIITVIGVCLVLIAMVGGVWWRQERIAYQPPADRPHLPSDVRRIEFIASDGQSLFAYDVEPSETPSGVLIAFHGNADLAAWQIPWAKEVARKVGWRVLLAEYRGYGGLDGLPSYLGIREDARAAWRAVAKLSEHQPVALFGHSLGSGVACELAAELEQSGHRIAALLLQSPFTSARDMARIVSTRPVQLLWTVIARVHYDTRARFNELVAPVHISHGARDWLVPVSMGRELFARAHAPGNLLIVETAGHNDVAETGGMRYWQWLEEALNAGSGSPNEARSIRRTETLG